MEFYIFLLYSLLLIPIHLIFKTKLLRKRSKLPPGPTGLPIIGNLLAVGDRPHESLTKLAQKHGSLMTVRIGSNTTVVASSEDMAKEILQKNDQSFLGRPVPDAVTAEVGYEISMAWISGGPKWRSLRKLCNTQIFTAQRLDALQELRHQMMEKILVGRVEDAREANEEIDIGRLVFGTTMNLLSNTMFSVDLVDPKSNTIEELKELIARIMLLAGKPNVSDFFPVLRPFDLQGIKKDIKVSYDRLHFLIEEIIDRRVKRRASDALPTCGDFLDIMLDTQDQGTEEFSRADITILLMDLFIGGTDTTTTTMEWAMTELIRNPKVLQKLRQELDENIGSERSIKENDIPRLPYLQAVLKEIMRLHPTAPLLLPHQAQTDVEVCGYIIPKNTQVLVNYWAISRDPKYWDNPTEFVPERFLGSTSNGTSEYSDQLMNNFDFRGTNFSYMPFSSGRRICPGMSMGVRMMSLMLASLVQRFDWKLPNGMAPQDMDMRDKFGVTLQRSMPLVATPVLVDCR